MRTIELTGWNDGNWREGKGTFGLRVYKKDRKLFCKIKKVNLELPNPHGKPFQIEIEIGEPFWNDCPELRHPKIREWMLEREDIRPSGRPWDKRNPPKYEARLTENYLQIIA